MDFFIALPVLKHHNYNLSKKWYVEFTDASGRHRISNGNKFGIVGDGNRFATKKERLSFFNILLSAILSNDYQISKGVETNKLVEVNVLKSIPPQITVAQLVAKFLESKTHLAPKTLKDYRSRLIMFSKFNDFGNMEIHCITKAMVLQFLNRQEMSATNQDNDLRTIRLLFNFAVNEGYISDNVSVKVKYKNEESTGNVAYGIDDIRRILGLLKTFDVQLYVCCLLEFYCMLRPKEVALLKTSDFDFVNNTITIRATICKTKRSRILPLHPDLKEVLIQNLSQFEKLYNADYYKTKWQRIKHKLNVPNGCTLYSFKHSGACELYLATKDIYLVSRFCGHKSISITEIYLRSLGVRVGNDDNRFMPSIA